VGEGEVVEVAGQRVQLLAPVVGIGVDGELAQDEFDDPVEQGGLGVGVPVERHRFPIEGLHDSHLVTALVEHHVLDEVFRETSVGG